MLSLLLALLVSLALGADLGAAPVALGADLGGAPVLNPAPKQATWTGERYLPPGRLSVVVSPSIAPEDANGAGILVERLQAAGLSARIGGARSRDDAVIIEPFDAAMPSEGYAIDIRQGRIRVRAADRRGLVWAAVTLSQLAQQGGFPVGSVQDHPSLPLRLAHVLVQVRDMGGRTISPGSVEDGDAAAALLPGFTQRALDNKLNGVVIELNHLYRFRSHPELALPQAADLDALRPVIDELHRYYAEPIPLLNLLGHQERLLGVARPDLMLVKLGEYPKRRNSRGGLQPWEAVYDPDNPEVQQIVGDMLGEAMDLFQPRYVHIGHDECGALRFVPRAQDTDIADLFARSMRWAHDRVVEGGARPMMWGDMLIDPSRVPGTAHGGYPGAPIWKAITQVPGDMLIVDWQYTAIPQTWPQTGRREDYPSVQWFAQHDLDVIGATRQRVARSPAALARFKAVWQRWASFAHAVSSSSHGQGMMVSHWGFGDRYAPDIASHRVASLVAMGEQGWNAGVHATPPGFAVWE